MKKTLFLFLFLSGCFDPMVQGLEGLAWDERQDPRECHTVPMNPGPSCDCYVTPDVSLLCCCPTDAR